MVNILPDLVTDLTPKTPNKKLADVTWTRLYEEGNSIASESLGNMGLAGNIENEYIAYFCTYKFVILT